jgi:hypothetical protein
MDCQPYPTSSILWTLPPPNNAPEHVIIAGSLHDVVEDADVTLSDIRDKFSDEVATLVDWGFRAGRTDKCGPGRSSMLQRTWLHGITSLCWMLLVMGISDIPAFKEFGKCVGEIFGDVKV